MDLKVRRKNFLLAHEKPWTVKGMDNGNVPVEYVTVEPS
ncbi:hypothetical protein NOC27_3034 [Nitrosococcus oceani AFC27]|nr:hypothetical protein NOC27_3034 [Nitrosococcus oceani AFC27]